jgi:hypothetical protein
MPRRLFTVTAARLDDPIRNTPHPQMAERNFMLLKENDLSAKMRKSPEPCSTVTFLDYLMVAGGGFELLLATDNT